MIARLIRWSVANRFLVLIASALLVAAALFSVMGVSCEPA